MALSIKINRITLKNFIGIYNGLGKKELVIDLTKLLDKDIIIILGENGTGKSTLASVLHPLPGTTDKRNRFIREGKEGVKIVEYIRSDGATYECKIVYSPTKTGHNSKGFIKKTLPDSNPVELNPNGNISSYKELLFDELGVSDAILKLSNQNDVCKGHVDMTSTERKVNMSSFLPEDIYSHYFAVVDKIYKEMKTRINVLVEALGKMNDEDVLKKELERVTNEINSLVEKRDKTIGKIKEYETRIDIIEKDDNLEKKENKLIKEIKSFDKELEKIRDSMSDIYNDHLQHILELDDTSKKITKLIEEFKKQINNDKMTLSILTNTITNLKTRRNSISDDIELKRSILKDVSSNKSLNELKRMLSDNKNRFNELDKLLSKLNTNLSKDDFMLGYDIVSTIRKMIDNIREFDKDVVEKAISSYDKREFMQNKFSSLLDKHNQLINRKNLLINQIASLNENSDLKDVLDKRPSNCKIDDCPFIENAQKWTVMETKINEYSKEIKDIDIKLDTSNSEINEIDDILKVINCINNALQYISNNSILINKLPYSDKYSTKDEFLKCIMKPNRLSDCDDFDTFIEILEYKDEHHQLKYETIPSIKTEIRILETQGKMISNTKNELAKLELDYNKIIADIDEANSNYSKVEEQLKFREDLVSYLETFYDKKIDYDELYKNMETSCNELKVLEKSLEEVQKYKDKLKDKKNKLKTIESELNPLTRKRELYKTEQLKIIDHKQELASIEEDMYKCEIIRDSLSIKGDGIPVDALEYFMDTVRQNANVLLSSTFDGSLYLEEFEINSKDFIIPYKKNGDRGMDVSFASSSERSFISLCLTLAIIEEVVSTYGIIILDEIDRGFSDNNKYKFINILGTQIRRVGISQTFMITHNREYYDGYDLGYILFPGHSLNNVNKNDVIKVYD